MSDKKVCPSCSRQIDEQFQFCPYDGTALGRTCPVCGKTWDASFQYCPLDSTPLKAAATQETKLRPTPPVIPEPAPSRAAAAEPTTGEPPPPANAPPPAPPPREFAAALTVIEQAGQGGWKAALLRPMTIIFFVGAMILGGGVYYLKSTTGGPDLDPPKISYALQPNEGKSAGVPVLIKFNQLAILLIDDPMEGGAASRAQRIVKAIEQAAGHASGTVGVRFAVEDVQGRPSIVAVTQAGPDPKTLATVTEGDLALASEKDGTKLASRWAERLTDAFKVFVFGEPPTFSVGTPFGDALVEMFKGAVGPYGKLTTRSLNRSFERLTPEKRKALETPPTGSSTTSAPQAAAVGQRR